MPSTYNEPGAPPCGLYVPGAAAMWLCFQARPDTNETRLRQYQVGVLRDASCNEGLLACLFIHSFIQLCISSFFEPKTLATAGDTTMDKTEVRVLLELV